MEEINVSHVVMGLGGVLVIFGILQVFLQTISHHREKSGRIRSSFTLRNWSSTYPGVIMIAIGALLLGVGPFVDAP
jgi:hypothetical protein